MKKITQLLSALVFCSLMIFISCNGEGPDEETDSRDQQAELLEGTTWTVSSATFEGDNRPDWEGATLAFDYNPETDQGTFSVSNVPDEGEGVNAVLGSGGSSISWSFPDENSVQTIVREDGVNMTVAVSETSLTLTFTIDEAGSRVAGFEGEWVFQFTAGS